MGLFGKKKQSAGDGSPMSDSDLEVLAANGDEEAMYDLGLRAHYADEPSEARTWWTKAADLDNPSAMVNLGLLANEVGDPIEARAWYEKAAKLDNPDAMFNLGVLTEEQFGRYKEMQEQQIKMFEAFMPKDSKAGDTVVPNIQVITEPAKP